MKRKILTVLAYTILVAVVLLLSQCEGSVTLTTVKKDARHIIELASQIESEEELKAVEKLARKYELGYQRMYNGAKALEFKRLTNDALREASSACEQIHAENKRIADMRTTFSESLSDLDAAWCHDITSVDEDIKRIKKNNNGIKNIHKKIAKIEGDIQALATKLIEANYPPEMLAEIGAMRSEIDALKVKIVKVENTNCIIRLAYKLHGMKLPESAQEIKEQVDAVAEESSTEQTETSEQTDATEQTEE